MVESAPGFGEVGAREMQPFVDKPWPEGGFVPVTELSDRFLIDWHAKT